MPDDHILQWGNPALYEPASPVAVFDDLLRAQATRLAHRLEVVDGAGLAATQVGSLRRMFAFRLSPEHGTDVLVNPRVVWRSPEHELFVEGCLSFNSVLVAVQRPVAVRVVGHDLGGNEREFECESFASSLMQHEIDHLDGILTLHRAAPAERRRAIAELLRWDAEAISRAA
jgi:peptide deformylase